MMGIKQKLKTAEEFDVVYAKGKYCYLSKSKIKSRIKKQMRKRRRKEGTNFNNE